MSGGIRCFVALALPAGLREAVAGHFAREGRGLHGVRWVAAGEPAPDAAVPRGGRGGAHPRHPGGARRRRVAGHAAFRLALRGAGAFPAAGAPARALGRRGRGGGARPRRWRRRSAAALAPLGFAPEERPFVPHLTVGRVVAPPRDRGPLRRLLEAARERDWGGCLVPAAHLLRSELFPAGPIYSILHETRLPARPRQD